MTNKIQMDLSVRDAQMVAAWKRSTQSVAAFNAELDKIGQKQRRNRTQSNSFFKGMSSNLASMAAGYVSVAGAASLLINANREIIEQAEEAASKYDELFRKFRIQSGLRGIEGDKARERILEISERQAVTSEQGSGAATQLVSSGFSAQEASGGSLEEFLRILNASNASGKEVDSAGLAKALSSYLDAQGLDKNEKNVALVGRSVQALFKNTNLQLADLQDLAKVSSVFKGKLSIQEQLGAFSTLVDSMPASEAKTGLRNFVLQSATASAQDEKVKTLDELGLKPTDIDFVGENLDQVLERLSNSLSKLPEEEQLPALTKIYEKENAAVVKSLIDKRGKVTDSYAVQQNDEAFIADVNEATSGRNAALRRAEARRERRRFQEDQQDKLKKMEAEALMEAEGASPFRRDLNLKGYDWARYLGADPDTALNIMNPWSWGSASEEVDEALGIRSKPASDYGEGELPPAPPAPPGMLDETRQEVQRLRTKFREQNQYDRSDPGEKSIPHAIRGFFRDILGKENPPPVVRKPARKPAEERSDESSDASYNPIVDVYPAQTPIPAISPASTDELTKALKENTAALREQKDKTPAPSGAQKPVQVSVSVTADASTAPNGPRASASLARPLK
ncbi:Phage-related minor tail protein [Gimesia chilikensis]|uniref:Phage-related minor tail protein n=1 Tax=Gimesia chilikensis TaxID=2605989 RepID=A0A517WD24_9PLAN|nr:phage tail tape measure protein [Gimesia chilikensis]QDU03144.1 Phage-related minor tail protein [Gimesia chilikensis]